MLRSSGKGLQASMLFGMLSEALGKEQQVWRPLLLKEPQEEENEIQPSQRDEAVKWLLEWNQKFKYCPETFMQSTGLLDRFLMAVKARPKYLRCIAFSCFFLGAKLREEDEDVPATEDLVQESSCSFSVGEVLRMELIVLDKLRWDLSTITALDFLQIFHAMLLTQVPHLLAPLGQMTPSRHLSILTGRLSQCLANHQLATFRPSVLALALLSLELEVVSRDWLTLSMMFQRLIGVDNQQLIRCRELITGTLLGHPGHNVVYIIAPPHPHSNHDKGTAGGHQHHDPKTAKRKNQTEEDDDIYASIKRLYNEDTAPPLPQGELPPPPVGKPPPPQGISSPALVSSCSSQMLQDQEGEGMAPCPPLQSIQVT
ncbi:cyclin-I-like [Patiria miniata]|uniref:Cyclin-like domain-containing protein n=1 Tax=Patiria miniata TaxID=46514 RepID=A0A913ZVH1_PATMI|nr:cyclin-I-like [Patiria miniata]